MFFAGKKKYMAYLCLALAALGGIPGRALATGTWDEFKLFISNCNIPKKRGADCLREIEALLRNEAFWGDTNNNYNQGKMQWPDQKLEIDFSAPKNEEGDFQIIKGKERLIPKISLSKKSDAYDLLITINHEIVHYANSKRLQELFDKGEKIDHCISPYRMALLENEKLAYLSEIYFWKTSPEWFKNEQKRTHFNSRILGRDKLTYAEYYRRLEEILVTDGNFVAKRYIELGKYPKCAAKLLDLTK